MTLFKLPATKPISFKRTISSDILIELNSEGKKNLFQFCDGCNTQTVHLRTWRAVRCCTCNRVMLLK